MEHLESSGLKEFMNDPIDTMGRNRETSTMNYTGGFSRLQQFLALMVHYLSEGFKACLESSWSYIILAETPKAAADEFYLRYTEALILCYLGLPL